MAKMSKKQIQLDEKQIIHELQKNGKESINKIAMNLGFSRQKVWRVIKNLEKNKLIWGYSAIVDPLKMDLTHYTVLIKRTIDPFGDDMRNRISKEKLDDYFPESHVTIEDCLYVNGTYDWILTITAPGIREMKMFCEKLMVKFGKHLTGYEVLETILTVRKQGIKNPSIEEQVKTL